MQPFSFLWSIIHHYVEKPQHLQKYETLDTETLIYITAATQT